MVHQTQPEQPKPLWHEMKFNFVNDSTLSFEPSERFLPVLKACRPNQKIDTLDCYATQQDVFRIECTGPRTNDSEHSAFLTYLVGETGKKLVVWLWMKPDRNAAEIKFAVVDENKVFDLKLLEKLSQDTVTLEEIGFEREFYWEFENKEERRELGIIADFGRSDLGPQESLSEFWSDQCPSAWIHFRDLAVQQERVRSEEADAALPEDERPMAFKISASWGQLKGNPVHESMTLAALIKAGCVPSGTTYGDVVGSMPWVNQPGVFEYFRGVIWNDDPACRLFNNSPTNNGNYAMGLDWYGDYLVKWKLMSDNIIYRSHFGDLQFLHAMGTERGEKAEKTREKILLWLEVMYKLAAGDGVSQDDRIDKHLAQELFNDTTTPKGSDSLKDLLMGTTPSYLTPIIVNRALGSCFHVIQDSYALGHCQRHLENPGDQIDVTLQKSLLGKIKDWWPWGEKQPAIVIKGFPRGRPGRFTYIQNFHCYEGQSEEHHGHYDDIPNGEELNPSDPSSFDCLVGAADAIDKCAQLADFWKNKTRWNDGVRQFLERVFEVQGASDSDTNIDEHLKR